MDLVRPIVRRRELMHGTEVESFLKRVPPEATAERPPYESETPQGVAFISAEDFSPRALAYARVLPDGYLRSLGLAGGDPARRFGLEVQWLGIVRCAPGKSTPLPLWERGSDPWSGFSALPLEGWLQVIDERGDEVASIGAGEGVVVVGPRELAYRWMTPEVALVCLFSYASEPWLDGTVEG